MNSVCNSNSRRRERTNGSMLGIAAAVLLRHNTASAAAGAAAAAATAAAAREEGGNGIPRGGHLHLLSFALVARHSVGIGINHQSTSDNIDCENGPGGTLSSIL